MLITFKTLQQKTFKIEIDENEKVGRLKEIIAEERGDEFPIDGQKLIYSGKILDDDKLLSEYKIDTVKNFVVVMAVKAKVKSAGNSATSTTSHETATSSSIITTTNTTTAASSLPISTAAASETTSSTDSTQPGSVTSVDSSMLTGSSLESSITELMSLGYSRQEVLRALTASFHNADRAAEYLLSGNIPDINEMSGSESEAVAEEPSAPTAVGDLSFLRNLPQFEQLRLQALQHPDTLPQLLQEIGRTNPQLLQLISQNQEAFIALLNEPVAQREGDGEGGGGSGARTGGGFQIQVTAEEKATIDRIVSMGFVEADVIQAFFACDKNEQLAIEFLLNQ